MNNKEIVIKILNSALNNKQINFEIDTSNQELMLLLKEQTFLPMAYYVSKNKNLKAYYLSSCLFHEEIDKMTNIVKNLFNENNIDHIFLKGSTLKNLYPDRNIRLLGDIDVLIKEKQLKKAIKILKNNGFIYESRASHHISFKYRKLELELHFNIIEKNIRLSEYLSKPFENAYLINKNTYQLNNEYNLIFIIAHYMKHLHGGSGLRSLCDIYLMIKNYNINLDNIKKVFKKYKYELFFDTLLTCLNIIFDYNDYSFNYIESANELIDYSLKSGIHGFGKNNNYSVNKQQANSNNKFIYLLKTLFIPLNQLFDFYPWTKSIILIPLGYICRFFHLIFKRQKQLKSVMKNKSNNNELFSNIGLK